MTGTTLGGYMRWLRDNGGECKTGHGADPEIGWVPKVRLISKEGRTAVVVNVKQEEALSPAMIAYLDRRLGVLSPFACGRPN